MPLLRGDVPRHVFLARSTDGGRTFVTTRAYEAPAGNKDRALNKAPTPALDPSDPKRVYIGWGMGVFANSKEKRRSMGGGLGRRRRQLRRACRCQRSSATMASPPQYMNVPHEEIR